MKIDIHIRIQDEYEYAFRWSCKHRYKDIAQWLYNLSKDDNNGIIDLRVDNDNAFRKSCEWDLKDVAEWLCTLDSDIVLNIRMVE